MSFISSPYYFSHHAVLSTSIFMPSYFGVSGFKGFSSTGSYIISSAFVIYRLFIASSSASLSISSSAYT